MIEAVQIETTKLLTLPDSTEGHAICDAYLPTSDDENRGTAGTLTSDKTQPLFGARMRGHKSTLADVCWSKDATQAFTCDTEGIVKVWDLKIASHTTDKQGVTLVTCIQTIQAEKSGISLSRVYSLPTINSKPDACVSRTFVPPFVTTSEFNTKVTLWGPTMQVDELPQ